VDVPLTAAELKEMPAQTVLVPTSLGAVEIAYHLDGVDNLRLTGELVADIYLGRVTKWNDARIASVNPGVSLPDKEIYPVFRLDGSGTTYVFTHYLSSVSPAWAESVGTGKSLTFPRGVAATGTPGVAGLVEKIPGAIGYVASGYSASFDIQRALLQNAAGNYVQPSTESITAAAALQTADTNVMLTDSPAAEAYPISCFSWVMLYRDQSYSGRTREQAEQTLAVLRWLVGPEAQNLAAREHYAPLPTAVAARAVELLDSVTYGGKPLK
jgi:phosphate ABC transporter,  phosphate-binding protein pstS